MNEFNAFITGSQVYGTPTEESDFDLVVLCDKKVVQILNHVEFLDQQTVFRKSDWWWVRLWKWFWNRLNGRHYRRHIAENTLYIDPDYLQYSVRFGSLNIIMLTDEEEFIAWKTATDELIKRKPVTRKEAVQDIEDFIRIFKEL